MSHKDSHKDEPARRDDATARFTGLAGLYACARPDYPRTAIDFILRRSGLGPHSTLVDVGCGTGISSRLLAERGVKVIGIEPNDDMRGQAQAAACPPDGRQPEYRAGRAEATGLPDACADAVLSAQAFHWFAADAALREFARILKPRGWVSLMWNERDEADPFSAGYGRILASTPEGAAMQVRRLTAGQALLQHPLFDNAACDLFPHQQILDEAGLLRRALSASYSPREPEAVATFTGTLRDWFARHQRSGRVALRYETAVYSARVRSGPA